MSKLSETLSEKPPGNLTAREVARPAPLSPEFSLEQRRTLLRIAHQAILSVLERQSFPEAPPLPAGLSDPRGVFTTLICTAIDTAIPTANFGDASAMPCPSRPCIAPWPKRPAPPLSKISVFCR